VPVEPKPIISVKTLLNKNCSAVQNTLGLSYQKGSRVTSYPKSSWGAMKRSKGCYSLKNWFWILVNRIKSIQEPTQTYKLWSKILNQRSGYHGWPHRSIRNSSGCSWKHFNYQLLQSGRLHNKIFLVKDNNIFKFIDISRIETLSYPAKAVAFEKCTKSIFVNLPNDIITCR